MHSFQLDSRLAGDTFAVAKLGLCELRLMNDSRWPWVILVPQREGIVEFHELTPLDQAMLTFETTLVARALKRVTGAGKINIGAIGNIVPMFHLHIVARSAGDTNWPRPVWGVEGGTPYEQRDAEGLMRQIEEAVLAS